MNAADDNRAVLLHNKPEMIREPLNAAAPRVTYDFSMGKRGLLKPFDGRRFDILITHQGLNGHSMGAWGLEFATDFVERLARINRRFPIFIERG